MSNRKELSDEELDKVTGGEGENLDTRNVVVRYKETIDGIELWNDLGRFPIAQAQADGETMAKEWCVLNNMIYTGWNLANFLSNNYDAKELLNTVSQTMTVKYPGD